VWCYREGSQKDKAESDCIVFYLQMIVWNYISLWEIGTIWWGWKSYVIRPSIFVLGGTDIWWCVQSCHEFSEAVCLFVFGHYLVRKKLFIMWKRHWINDPPVGTAFWCTTVLSACKVHNFVAHSELDWLIELDCSPWCQSIDNWFHI